jgi:two-component system osmolarity sensor histidine kinase EnvZ
MSSDRIAPDVRDGMTQDIEDMDAIVSQFLDFAREGSRESTDPAADLNAMVRSLAERYEKRGEQVRLRLRPLPPLRLKPLAMQRMITNLVDNALLHGSPEVEIETAREPHAAVLRILDRGPGIPPAEVDRVMQPFTRLEAARTGTRGSGLGLAIVDRIARLHGGQLKLAPREGGGLEARVELPLEPPPELEQAA